MPWGHLRHGVAVAGVALLGAFGPLAGCGDDRAAAPDDTERAVDASSTTAGEDTTTTTVGGRLADVDFENFTYDFYAQPSGPSSEPVEPSPIAVVDGSFSDPEDGVDPLSAGARFFLVTDVDFADLDGDGEDEAAISVVKGFSRSPAQDTNVLIYRAGAGGPEYVTAVGWSDRADGAVNDVSPSNGADGERFVVQLIEPIDEECCSLGIVERSYRLSGDRLAEAGDAARWPIVDVAGLGVEPVAVSFLPGSQRAGITGILYDEPHPVTFDAVAGQVLSLRVRALDDGDEPFTVAVGGPDGEVGTVAPGQVVDAGFDLPSSGTYSITVVPDDPVGDVTPDTGQPFWVDFVLTD